MMRQAGPLPARVPARSGESVSFLELCRSVDLAAEVSLQPFRRFAPDGVIFFSDILVPAEAMGARVEFGDGGPSLPEPVRSASDVARLSRFDPARAHRASPARSSRRLAREVGDRAGGARLLRRALDARRRTSSRAAARAASP